MRIATIGTSTITATFAGVMAEFDDLTHAAVISRNTQRGQTFAHETGGITGHRPRVITQLSEAAAADDIDAVYIASPNSVHHAQARELLRAGKHVLVEKSATSNRDQFVDLMEVAETSGVALLEAMRSVHDPGFARIRSLLPELGPLRRAEFRLCQYSSRYDRFLAGETPAIFDPELSAGALMDIGTYCAHPMTALWGEPSRIHAEATLLRTGVDGAGTVVCGYDFPGGFAASLHYSKITTSPLPSSIEGEHATLAIDSITTPRELVLHRSDGISQIVTVDAAGGGSNAPENMRYELEEFLRLASTPADQRDDAALRAHQQASLDTLAVLDRTRQILGIRFPGDPWA